MKATRILDEDGMRRSLRRMAHQILEQLGGAEDIAFVGIPTRGLPLAERLSRMVRDIEGTQPPVGQIDIGPYRDDERRTGERSRPIAVQGRRVVLVDDVLHTGRTTRAALDAIVDWGRPHQIMLLVLVDRGHRELPIRADFVGKNVPTAQGERVVVHVSELDGLDEVLLVRDNDA